MSASSAERRQVTRSFRPLPEELPPPPDGNETEGWAYAADTFARMYHAAFGTRRPRKISSKKMDGRVVRKKEK